MHEKRSVIMFVAAQLLLIGGLAMGFVWRTTLRGGAPQWPAVRNVPRTVTPTIADYSGYEVVVTDEQLARVLRILRPGACPA